MEISVNELSKRVYTLRGVQVMLDSDLAESYGVEVRILKRAVRENIQRFPSDFMFELTKAESENSRSRIWISSSKPDFALHGGNRYLPFAFTETGIGMLSSVLHSQRAIQVNIEIMRAFVQLRKQSSWMFRIESLERRVNLLEDQPKTQKSQDPVRLIQNVVAQHWGLTIEDLQSAGRKKSISLPRHVAVYLIRNQLHMSFSEIGQYFGRRDHTTMMHAYRKISAASSLQETLNFLQNKISSFRNPLSTWWRGARGEVIRADTQPAHP
jgi:hypothetical protein